MNPELRVIGVPGLPEIAAGDDLAALIASAITSAGLSVAAGDVLVVTHKIVSKAEGRVVRLADVQPSQLARRWGASAGKDPRLIELALAESTRIVRMTRGVLIAETRHGFICANAGVDASNVKDGLAVLLPLAPDVSAARLRGQVSGALGVDLPVIVTDTFGRPWREGQVNVAIGMAGLRPLTDYRGQADTFGRRLQATVIAVADEIASAAELVMRKTTGVPVAVVRGAPIEKGDGTGRDLLRPAAEDLFR